MMKMLSLTMTTSLISLFDNYNFDQISTEVKTNNGLYTNLTTDIPLFENFEAFELSNVLNVRFSMCELQISAQRCAALLSASKLF